MPSFGSYLRRCSQKQFQFCLRKYHGTYITPIHHNPFLLPHSLLLGYQEGSNLLYSRNLRCQITHFQRTNICFHIFAIKGYMLSIHGFDKINTNILQHSLYIGQIILYTRTQGIERNSSIHSSSIHIGISCILSQRFSYS